MPKTHIKRLLQCFSNLSGWHSRIRNCVFQIHGSKDDRLATKGGMLKTWVLFALRSRRNFELTGNVHINNEIVTTITQCSFLGGLRSNAYFDGSADLIRGNGPKGTKLCYTEPEPVFRGQRSNVSYTSYLAKTSSKNKLSRTIYKQSKCKVEPNCVVAKGSGDNCK